MQHSHAACILVILLVDLFTLLYDSTDSHVAPYSGFRQSHCSMHTLQRSYSMISFHYTAVRSLLTHLALVSDSYLAPCSSHVGFQSTPVACRGKQGVSSLTSSTNLTCRMMKGSCPTIPAYTAQTMLPGSTSKPCR